MDTQRAIDIAKFLGLSARPLERPFQPKGIDGRPGKTITHTLTLHLDIEGHRQDNIPFLLLDLGTHDVILGIKWMAYFKVWLNPHRRCLMWPDDPLREQAISFQRELQVPKASLQVTRPDRDH